MGVECLVSVFENANQVFTIHSPTIYQFSSLNGLNTEIKSVNQD